MVPRSPIWVTHVVILVVLFTLHPACAAQHPDPRWSRPRATSRRSTHSWSSNRCEGPGPGRELLPPVPGGDPHPARERYAFHRGAAHLALQSRAPVLPILVACEPPREPRVTDGRHVEHDPCDYSFRAIAPLDLPWPGLTDLPPSQAARKVTAWGLEDRFRVRRFMLGGSRRRTRGLRVAECPLTSGHCSRILALPAPSGCWLGFTEGFSWIASLQS